MLPYHAEQPNSQPTKPRRSGRDWACLGITNQQEQSQIPFFLGKKYLYAKNDSSRKLYLAFWHFGPFFTF